MAKQQKSFVVESAEAFKTDGGYRFPFDAMDQTPGGSNLGRIEWHVEFIRSHKKGGRIGIKLIYVWASQTRDPRYAGKVFAVECDTPGIMSSRRTGRHNGASDFASLVWFTGFCPDHASPVLCAYPENNHRALVFYNLFTSVGSDIFFAESAS